MKDAVVCTTVDDKAVGISDAEGILHVDLGLTVSGRHVDTTRGAVVEDRAGNINDDREGRARRGGVPVGEAIKQRAHDGSAQHAGRQTGQVEVADLGRRVALTRASRARHRERHGGNDCSG